LAQVYSSSGIEPDSFTSEQLFLDQLGTRSCPPANATARIHHPVPRNGAALGQSMEGISDLPGMPSQSG
jgi:hypothetical protein